MDAIGFRPLRNLEKSFSNDIFFLGGVAAAMAGAVTCLSDILPKHT